MGTIEAYVFAALSGVVYMLVTLIFLAYIIALLLDFFMILEAVFAD